MITLDWLKARVKEHEGCWVWNGYIDANGSPQANINNKRQMVRREVYRLAHGREPGKNFVGVNCTTWGCAHPQHVIARTRSAAFLGKPRSLLARASIARGRRKDSKLPQEAVRQFQAGQIDAQALMAYGIGESHVDKIAKGINRRDYGGVWQGLA